MIGQDLATIPRLAYPEWVAMQDREPLEAIQRIVGGGRVNGPYRRSGGGVVDYDESSYLRLSGLRKIRLIRGHVHGLRPVQAHGREAWHRLRV